MKTSSEKLGKAQDQAMIRKERLESGQIEIIKDVKKIHIDQEKEPKGTNKDS